MIDIHSHILPGMDDGARDLYDTLDMVDMAARSGVRAIVATPHCNIPGAYKNYFNQEYVALLEKVRKAVKAERIPVQILPGMEAFATRRLPELIVQRKIMPLNLSRYILVEFDFGEDPDFVDVVLGRMLEVGARPVIAHAERYEFVQEEPELVYEWRKKGYAVQINKGSFQGRFGRGARRTACLLMDHKLVSVVASDAHGSHKRTPYMMDVYEELEKEYPKKYLKVLFEENPRRICENRPTLGLRGIPFTAE